MCQSSEQYHRRGLLLGAALVVVLIAPTHTPHARASTAEFAEAEDAIETYLADRGLDALLAVQLRARLSQSVGARQAELAEQLAELYVKLMDAAETDDERDRLEALGRELLSAAPKAASTDLRLSLHRAVFKRAEKTAESWRLRLVEPVQRDEALRAFRGLRRELEAIGAAAHRIVEDFERQEEAAREADLDLIGERLAIARRQRSLAMFLAGWAATYTAELTNAPGAATDAMQSFGWLLNAQPGKAPEIDRVHGNLLAYEHVARAAIGVGICESIRGNADEALRWLDKVEIEEHAAPPVLAELPARRMTVLARAQRWFDLDRFITEVLRKRGGSGLSVGEARMLAVLALDADPHRKELIEATRSLAQTALTSLVQQGELAQVLDLATKYGTAPIGSTGFIAHHVRGLRAYESARAAHQSGNEDSGKPTKSADIAQTYRQAVVSFEAALAADDATQFERARGNTAFLLGLSLYYGAAPTGAQASVSVQDLRNAARRLAQASLLMSDDARAADALALAIRALDMGLASGADDDARTERSTLVKQFIEEHSTHRLAASMLLKQGTSGELSAEESVELLLRIRADSPAYETARRHASRLLWKQYRESPPDEREWTALRYSEIAEPLLFLDRVRAGSGDARTIELVMMRSRRVLDALLGSLAPDVSRANRALDAAQSMYDEGLLQGSELAAEFAYRRAQIALARGDVVLAKEIVNSISSESEDGQRYASAATRLLFRHATMRWRDAKKRGAPADETLEAAQIVVQQGAKLLQENNEDVQLQGGVALTVLTTVGEAAADLWRRRDDENMRGLAIRMFRNARTIEPRSRMVLRELADLSEDALNYETAIDCWRDLSAGLRVGSRDWFEVRYRLIQLLSKTDLSRARSALDQLKVLHPDLGPEPWSQKLRQLDAQLNNSDAPPAGGAK